MHFAMSDTLALLSWRDFRLFLGGFADSGAIWLLIGFLLAIVVLSALATDAALVLHAPHRLQARTKRPVDLSESSIPSSSVASSSEPLGSGSRQIPMPIAGSD